MIVTARAKAAHDRPISIGWYAAAFARTEKLKPLPDYLIKPAAAPAQKNEGASNVLALFKAKAKKKGTDDGAR